MSATSLGLAAALLAAGAGAEEADVRLRVTVVLDASQSMDDQDPGHLAEVAARLLVDLATPRDEVSIVRFGTSARRLGREVVRDDPARERLYSAIDEVTRTEWCTDYRVGLEAALEAMPAEARPGERRLVIFLTDGLYDPDRSNEGYYDSDEGREALERARATEPFAERPCARRYGSLAPHVEGPFLQQMGRLADRLGRSGVRLYAVGLGPALTSTGEAAERSRSLLERLSGGTGGAFLAATSSDQLPVFFASIYSALVGAPVEPPREVPAETERIDFEVLRGASRVAVIVDAEADQALRVEARPAGGGAAPAHDLRRYHAPGEGGQGYRVLSFDAPEPGAFVLHRLAGEARLRIQVIQEVGLRLVLDGVPPAAPDGTAPRLSVGLRSSAGESIQLSREFLSHITFGLEVRRGDASMLDRSLRPGEDGDAAVALDPLSPGEYRFAARAAHSQGLLEVAPVEATAHVLHQLDLAFDRSTVTFDVMAEEGESLGGDARIALAAGSSLPIDQTFEVDWSGVEGREDLVLEPARVVLGPEKRAADVSVRLRDPRGMRRADQRYSGDAVLTPAQPELYRGDDPRWEPLSVDGRVRPWTLGRYHQEYWPWIWGSVTLLLLLLWVIGRLTASKWSKKARLHYVELDDPTKTETTILLRRKSRSHLPFRSDRHHCGRGGSPGKKGKKRYCDLVAQGRAGFFVIPGDVPVTRGEGDDEITSRKQLKGRWEDRYRLGDRYEIWLTRT